MGEDLKTLHMLADVFNVALASHVGHSEIRFEPVNAEEGGNFELLHTPDATFPFSVALYHVASHDSWRCLVQPATERSGLSAGLRDLARRALAAETAVAPFEDRDEFTDGPVFHFKQIDDFRGFVRRVLGCLVPLANTLDRLTGEGLLPPEA
jgi:hypothetical protein